MVLFAERRPRFSAIKIFPVAFGFPWVYHLRMASWFGALMNSLLLSLALGSFVLPFLLACWSVTDAKRRNKSPLLVALAVVFFFPIGLIAWLLFRPEPIEPGSRRRPFNLQDFRVQ